MKELGNKKTLTKCVNIWFQRLFSVFGFFCFLPFSGIDERLYSDTLTVRQMRQNRKQVLMKKKKYIVIFCVFSLLLSLLSSCGFNEYNNQIQCTEIDSTSQYEFSTRTESSVISSPQISSQLASLSPGDIRNILGLRDFPSFSSQPFSVAVLDTGIYPHPDLSSPQTHIIASVDFVNDITVNYDDNGHGTAIAGIINGIAPFVDFVSLKILNYECKGSISDSIDAINWVVENKEKYNIRVMNISVGLPVENIHFDKLSTVAEKAYQNGIIVVASVGNISTNSEDEILMSPAVGKHVLSVGSVCAISESDGFRISDFSSSWSLSNGVTGPDLLAPGENIVSLQSDVYYKGKGEFRTDVGYTQPLSGTSEAAAVISGVVANLLLIHPSYSADQIVELLLSYCKQIPGEKTRQGNGLFQYKEGAKGHEDEISGF